MFQSIASDYAYNLQLSELDIKKVLRNEWHSAKNCTRYLKYGSKHVTMFICDPYTVSIYY